jgi:tRNA (guanine-N7-)-methyltransferase
MIKRAIDDFPKIALDPEMLGEKVNFDLIFGRSGPVHIEIGSGKGSFLLSQSLHNPHVNFLGIEWARKYCQYCVDRFGRRGIENVRMIRADAADFVSRFIPDSSVACFHVYFPDPWPKTRHHKRRFLSNCNIPHLYRCLNLDGTIRFVTDDAQYYQATTVLVQELGFYWEARDFIPLPGTPEGELVGTNYERKYRKEGRSVYAMEIQKRTVAGVYEYPSMRVLLNPTVKSSDKIYHRS